MLKKFRGLRIIGLILKIIGGIELFIGILSVILIPLVLSNADSVLIDFGLPANIPGIGIISGIILGGLIFLVGIVSGLLTFSMGELFNVLIAIEENTRYVVDMNNTQK